LRNSTFNGGSLISFSSNNNKVFLLSLALFFAAFWQVGCFRPESSLAGRSDDHETFLSYTKSDHPQAGLDHGTEWSLQRYGETVRKYSNKYDLDWRLVMAVMRHESRFAANAVSHRGAFGLMQIMPATQAELADKLGVEETESPSNNIKAGIYHLQQLYRSISGLDEENHIRLTLAAYNAGLNRVFDAQDVAEYLGYNPQNWQSIKSVFPLLTKRYQNLHRNIWPSGKPRAGYFTDWNQTQLYVESIMAYYTEYQVALK
jgi:membrane-bound lytic murein transglycosylase MltF